VRRAVVWRGLDEPRMEIAYVDPRAEGGRASGTQIGVAYELRYELEPGLLRLELVGGRSLEVELGGLDYFDLGVSPLFNSLPVWGDRVLDDGEARDYVMRFVSVPELVVSESHQRYAPLGGRRLRYSSGDFTAVLDFDHEGLVDRYEGLAERVG
jgi:Putative glycolipid-binding